MCKLCTGYLIDISRARLLTQSDLDEWEELLKTQLEFPWDNFPPKPQEEPKAKCDCGAEKCGQPAHSTWCSTQIKDTK